MSVLIVTELRGQPLDKRLHDIRPGFRAPAYLVVLDGDVEDHHGHAGRDGDVPSVWAEVLDGRVRTPGHLAGRRSTLVRGRSYGPRLRLGSNWCEPCLSLSVSLGPYVLRALTS